jgi:hypothetical protein
MYSQINDVAFEVSLHLQEKFLGFIHGVESCTEKNHACCGTADLDLERLVHLVLLIVLYPNIAQFRPMSTVDLAQFIGRDAIEDTSIILVIRQLAFQLFAGLFSQSFSCEYTHDGMIQLIDLGQDVNIIHITCSNKFRWQGCN